MCNTAVQVLLDRGLPCHFEDAIGRRCVNTKLGHAKGHQDSVGARIGDGRFIGGPFDSAIFQDDVESEIMQFLSEINLLNTESPEERQRFASKRHLNALQSAEDQSFWQKIPGTLIRQETRWRRSLVILDVARAFLDLFREPERTNTCFGCLFGRPEYRLPCGHLLCMDCMRDFDGSEEHMAYPGLVVHYNCPFCRDNARSRWPVKARLQPHLGGLRILSLDGGGVRGIVELIVLKRLEDAIGL
jgi:hypothetical protein